MTVLSSKPANAFGASETPGILSSMDWLACNLIRMTSRVLVWFAAITAFSACSHDFQLMRMEEQVNGYGAAIRWNQCRKALAYLEHPDAFAGQCEKLRGVRVTVYQVVSRDHSPDGKNLSQLAEIHYVPADGVIERKLQDQQTWRLDENRDRWLLQTGLPSLD